MPKYLIGFLLFFFMFGWSSLYAQDSGDSAEMQTLPPDSLYQLSASSGLTKGVTVRKVDQKHFQKYRLNPDYAYANDADYWKKLPAKKPGFNFRFLSSPAWRWGLLIGVIGLAVFGLFLLAKENHFSLLSRSTKQIIPGSTDTGAIQNADFESLIRKYQDAGDLRMAVRYMYLQLILTLQEKRHIPLRDSTTNAEIARALGDDPLAMDFKYLAMAYEYIYYGSFMPKAELYQEIRNKFENFQQVKAI